MSKPTPHRPTTADEAMAIMLLQTQVGYPPASWDKRFARQLSTVLVTEREVPQVWRLLRRYRRQWQHPERRRLLALADTLAAPDFRAQRARSAAMAAELERYKQAMKGTPQ